MRIIGIGGEGQTARKGDTYPNFAGAAKGRVCDLFKIRLVKVAKH